MAKLILKFKEAVLREIPLDRVVTTIGRGQHNDIVIDNLAVSGSHARVVEESGRFFVEDLNSTNGTFVHDRRISRHPLDNNAVITIGKHTLQYQGPPKADSDATLNTRKMVDSESTVMIDTKKMRVEMTEPGQDQQTKPTVDARPGPVELVGGFTVIEGGADKPEYELTRRVTTIGKAETAEIRMKGFFAPKIAAIVNRTREGYVINPAAGEKKPLINGKPIDAPYLLQNLDMVELGNLRLQFFLKEE